MESRKLLRGSTALIPVYLAVLIFGTSCPWPAGLPELQSLEGDPALPDCGFQLGQEPSETPSDPCSAGTAVIGPETFIRSHGSPTQEVRTFSVPEPGAVCVLITNQGESSARVGLDGVDLLTPDRLNPHVSHLSVTENVDEGDHELSVELASRPGTAIDVEVRFAATNISPVGRVLGDKGKVAVWNLYDDPDPFSPGNQNGINDVTQFGATAQVLHFDGGLNFSYWIHYVFQVTDPTTCGQIRMLSGIVPLDPTGHVAGIPVTSVWDGRDDGGEMLPEGTYYYRVAVRVLRQNSGGRVHALDTVFSPVQTVTIDNSPQVDEPVLVSLDPAPDEIADLVSSSFEEPGPPFEVEEPVSEPPTENPVDDGSGPVRCIVKVGCDAEDTGGKGVCPAGYVQYTEHRECDRLETDQDGEAMWQNRIRPYLANNWFTAAVLSGYWLNSLSEAHPYRAEKPGNFADDNCNGLIDETEFVYERYGQNIGPGQFAIHAKINDSKIRTTANFITAHVYDLADLDCHVDIQSVYNHPAIQALRIGAFSYQYGNPAVTFNVPQPVARRYFIYGGEPEFLLDIDGLPVETKVYAVALTYHHVELFINWEYWQLRCIEADGSVSSNTTCGLSSRIASDVFFTATEGDDWGEERLRRLVANRALREWSHSEHLGLVGGPANAGADEPDGERYGASYGENWCTEFPAKIFYWTFEHPSPFGFATNVDDMAGYFRNRGWLDEDGQARDNMGIRDPGQYGALGPAEPGDYLALATHEGTGKTHSSLFLSNAGTDGNWKIGGNESRRVRLTCNNNLTQTYSHWYFVALGHITALEPKDIDP
jgi:hypothetical protein